MKTTDNPLPQRFPDRSPSLAPECWWVAKVKPRQEKQFAADLFGRNIEYYLPLYKKNSPRPGSRRPRLFDLPLFPGYVPFAQNQPTDIFSTGRVVNLVEVRHQQRFVRELHQIYCLLQGKAPLEPVTATFAAGSFVKIIHGPFAGIIGRVSRDTASLRLLLNVECLGNALLTIERSWIEEVDERDALSP